jgi:hypothetical protein
MTHKNSARTVLGICILSLFALTACSSKVSLEQEAEKFAQEYWETLFTKCLDTYVVKRSTWYAHASIGYRAPAPPPVNPPAAIGSDGKPVPRMSFEEEAKHAQMFPQKALEDDGHNSPEAIDQYSLVTITLEPEPITEFVDQLTQTEFRAVSYFRFQSSRFYSPTKKSWSFWETNADKKFKARVVKREGKWEIYGVNTEIIGRNKIKEVFKNVESMNCAALPQ